MGDNPRKNSQDLFHILGFGSICRACKSFLSKCYPDKHSLFFKKTGNKAKPKSIEEDAKAARMRNQNTINRNSDKDDMQEMDDQRGDIGPSPRISTSTGPSHLSRNASRGLRSTSRRSQTTMAPAKGSVLRTMSQRNSLDVPPSAFPRSLSRSTSTSRTGSTPIVYSNSNGLLKPPAMEQQLECTLEELCFGCVKKIKITRDAITDNGQIVKEDEVFRIKVKPGWRKGTRITFEGMGNEIAGAEPADVVFVVAEKKHPLFRRQEDDLELGLEIPLVEALTSSTLLVPLLGGETMSLDNDDIVQPGSEKIIKGQGMPKQNEPGTRGNLRITFSIKFPKELTEEQRSDAANILKDSC